MKINWKDFGLALIIGIVILIIGTEVISITSEVAPLFVFLLLISSLSYYFFKNKCEYKTATMISFIFGLIIIPLSILILIAVRYVDLLLHGLTDPMYLGLNTWGINWIAFPILGILSSVIGLIIWFAVNKLKWEKS